jgi:hypothetical protein
VARSQKNNKTKKKNKLKDVQLWMSKFYEYEDLNAKMPEAYYAYKKPTKELRKRRMVFIRYEICCEIFSAVVSKPYTTPIEDNGPLEWHYFVRANVNNKRVQRMLAGRGSINDVEGLRVPPLKNFLDLVGSDNQLIVWEEVLNV